MNLTPSQKRIETRRSAVKAAFDNKGKTLVSMVVKNTAEKLGVSEPTIWADLEKLGLTESNKSA